MEAFPLNGTNVVSPSKFDFITVISKRVYFTIVGPGYRREEFVYTYINKLKNSTHVYATFHGFDMLHHVHDVLGTFSCEKLLLNFYHHGGSKSFPDFRSKSMLERNELVRKTAATMFGLSEATITFIAPTLPQTNDYVQKREDVLEYTWFLRKTYPARFIGLFQDITAKVNASCFKDNFHMVHWMLRGPLNEHKYVRASDLQYCGVGPLLHWLAAYLQEDWQFTRVC